MGSIFDWVTFAIAVIGFLLSIYNFVAALIVNFKRLEISVEQICHCNGFAGLVLKITNKSRLNISLTSGQLILGNKQRIRFGEISTIAVAQKLPYMEQDTLARPKLFPIRLDSLMSVRVFMQTDYWDADLPQSCKLSLSTSRGSIRKKIALPAAIENGLQLLQYLE